MKKLVKKYLDGAKYESTVKAFESAKDRYSKTHYNIDYDTMDSLGCSLGKQTLDKYKQKNIDLTLLSHWSETPEKSKNFIVSCYIGELSNSKDIKNFFSSYINSIGLKRILNNQKEWYNTRHPYRRYFKDYEGELLLKNLKENNKNQPNILHMDLYSELSFHNIPYKTNIIGTRDSKEFPIHFVEGHEYAHGMDSNTYRNAQIEALDLNQNTNISKDDVSNYHDSKINEKHSDIWGLRYLLYKEGIYDSRGDKDITPKLVKLLREKYPELRPLKLMTDELVAKLLNLIAIVPDNSNITFAKKGNKLNMKLINKYLTGSGNQGIQKLDNTRILRVDYFEPIKIKKEPFQNDLNQSLLIQDNRSLYSKNISNLIKLDLKINKFLYLNLYLWNWTNPYSNITTTPFNAKDVYNYNNNLAINLFGLGTGIVYPLATAGSITGGMVGNKIGLNINGEKGAVLGGLLGSAIGGASAIKVNNYINSTLFVRDMKSWGIQEALKNMHNKYTAPKTTIKITPYKGDNLKLVRERLNNGGYDKIGISKDATIEIPVNHPLAKLLKIIEDNTSKTYSDNNPLLYYSPYDENFVKVNAREFLNKLEALIDPNEPLTHNNAVYKGGTQKQMYSPTSGRILEIDTKNPNLITSHEFWHAVDDVLHSLGKKPLQNLLEGFLIKANDKVNPPGFDSSKITNNKIIKYFTHNYGTELNARLMQIKNWLGKKNAYDPITVDEWNYARRYYGNTLDNNMLQLFRAVTDPKAFLDWINPRVATYTGLLGTGVKQINDENK